MIDEELEHKLLHQSKKSLDKFLDELTPFEQMIIISLPPELFAKIWHAASISTVELFKEIQKTDD